MFWLYFVFKLVYLHLYLKAFLFLFVFKFLFCVSSSFINVESDVYIFSR